MFYVYAVSDSIGETCELVSKSIASQFIDDISVIRVPHINTIEKAEDLMNSLPEEGCLIVSTIVTKEIEDYIKKRAETQHCSYFSILLPVIDTIELNTGAGAIYKPGQVWTSMDESYFKKISAIEFAIHYDDSKDHTGLDSADLILIGLSRTSKTPLSMYLAYKGLKVINIPLIPEIPPPKSLFKVNRNKIIALTIDPMKLIEIRRHRLEKYGLHSYNSAYLKDERILEELDYSDKLIKRLGCKTIDVTDRAIEDTALIVQRYLVSLKE